MFPTETLPTASLKQPCRPHFPLLRSGKWLFKEPPAKSKFLATQTEEISESDVEKARKRIRRMAFRERSLLIFLTISSRCKLAKDDIRIAIERCAVMMGVLLLIGAMASTARGEVTHSAVRAQTNMNGTFPAPNPRKQDSGWLFGADNNTATAADQISYTDPDMGWTVTGKVRAAVETGTIKLTQDLTVTEAPQPGIGMDSFVTGSFNDLVTITGNPTTDEGSIKVSDIIDGYMRGNGPTWFGDINLQINIENYSTLTIYTVKQEHKEGTLGTSDSSSGPATIPVKAGDVLGLVATENLSGAAQEAPGQPAYFNGHYEQTTHVYIQSLTPGLGFTTDSGYGYQPPAAPPVLSIRTSNGSVVLSWPSAYVDATLEQNPDLTTPGNWVPSSYPITTVDGINSITITSPAGKMFFRLKYPR